MKIEKLKIDKMISNEFLERLNKIFTKAGFNELILMTQFDYFTIKITV